MPNKPGVDIDQLRNQVLLMREFGLLPKPKKKRKRKVNASALKPGPNALSGAGEPHAPVGYPCRRCGITNNILHVGAETDEDNPINVILEANKLALHDLALSGFRMCKCNKPTKYECVSCKLPMCPDCAWDSETDDYCISCYNKFLENLE